VGCGGSENPGRAREHADHDLGKVDFPVSCSPAARTEFNAGVALLHHMTYPQAREAFQQVSKTDSGCAMAHWGVAMTLFQPLWPTRPSPDELRRGWEAAQQAQALGPGTERERLFVAATEAFFQEPTSADYWQRIRRWEQAQERLFTAFPDDAEAAVFYALAHLATTPANAVSRAHADRAAAILTDVYARNPDHPGVMHYLVHANDVPGRERQLLDVVRRYETIAPENPHALHMPSHIYVRLGDWDGVIRGNLRAAEASLRYPAGDSGQFVWDEFPHATEYLVYADLQKGADSEAVAWVRRLHDTARLQPSFKTAFHLASTRTRLALERRAWGEAAGLVPREPSTLRWDRFMWPEAVTWFGRGLGAAHQGDLETARAARARLDQLEAGAGKAGEELFARHIRILGLALGAWLAHAERDGERGVALMREAAALEASTPKHAVTPAPTLPAYELLGDLLLEQGLAREALEAYNQSLARYPRRFLSLLGSARAARAGGEVSLARTRYQELLDLAGNGSRESLLEEARAFVRGR
jgi:tetratricopeptide (TPR) repeat protein